MLTDRYKYMYWLYVYHLRDHTQYRRKGDVVWFVDDDQLDWTDFGNTLSFERFILKYCII